MKTKNEMETVLETYCNEHRDEIIQHMLNVRGFANTEELWDFEYHGGFGFDCGWVKLYPRDDREYTAWKKADKECHSPYIFFREPYQTQSTTLQRIQAEYVLEKLGLNGILGISVTLD